MVKIEELDKKFGPEFKRKVAARVKALKAQMVTLGELRKASDCTQVKLAKALGIGQHGISRIEQRKDLKLSTLQHYVEALGGELDLVVRLPEHRAFVLWPLPRAALCGHTKQFEVCQHERVAL